MSEVMVLLEFAGQPLALTQTAFREALERGREMVGVTAPDPAQNGGKEDRLMTAEEMEGRTKVGASWFLEQARRGELPHVRLGKYVRFQFDEVLACSRFRERAK